jgi:hypothetical protein
MSEVLDIWARRRRVATLGDPVPLGVLVSAMARMTPLIADATAGFRRIAEGRRL